MIKYPSLYSPRELQKLLNKVPELLDLETFIEPKYDGSNITIFHEQAATRNLNPLPKQFAQGLREALGKDYDKLIQLSNKYQVFLELGGTKNAPAGYVEAWDDKWDYRIFDLYAGQFLQPPKVQEIVEKMGLKFVGYEAGPKLETILNIWPKLLNEKYGLVEGMVVKVFPLQQVLEKLRKHFKYKHNMVGIKLKHEYLGKYGAGHIKVKKAKEKGEPEPKRPERALEPSEIYGAINKAHLILGDDIFNPKKAMPLIFKLVKEEAEKHNAVPPKAGKLFKMYQEYLKRIKN